MKATTGEMKEVEKRAYLSWHRDGLADTGIGLLVLIFGIGMKTDTTWLAPIYGCLGYPLWLLLKQWITERRLGWVAFGAERKRREKRGWTIMLIMGCGIFVLATGAYLLVRGASGGGLPGILLISLIFVVLTSGLGIILQLIRLQVYSGIILLFGVAGNLLEWKPETGVILPGAIIVIAGLILLVTFVRKYPLIGPDDAVSGEGSMGQGQ